MVIADDSILNDTIAYIRSNGVKFGIEALVNFAGPFVIYSLVKPTWGDAYALIASSALPIAWSLVEFIRARRVDALSLIVLTGIALSLLAFMGGGDVRFLQLRERLVTALIGMIFLGSAATGWPLMYYLARAKYMRRSASEAQALEALRDNVHVRHTLHVMTLVWGFGLVGEAALCAVLVFELPIRQYMVVSGIIGYGALAALGLWTAWYGRRRKRQGEARLAAAERAGRMSG
jgi:hypothetical protein